jgi:transposase
MGRPYSNDLRERVVRAVIKGGLSRHQAAAQFGVGISTAINWSSVKNSQAVDLESGNGILL